ncbi:hypothetical protein CANTEDRAFT_112908 [Yamadazyma tenuis ATCC 10573]|nr:uncharacterized protein CANTEDRAFT_112908 [Yamadazyma tenuis ATCC 10573]EGV66292.1 hypothetical protein CANTEDRAFT_112908 [Yamadazyma tenuis ATCC 10573]
MARNSTAFSGRWHANWLLTGVFLGLACSSKSSGLLTYGWIGILAFLQLWTVLGDLEVSDFGWWKHLVARIVYLVGVPFTIYLAAFSLHFHALPNVGPGAGPMTPQFKATFKDYDTIRKEPVEVVYGSTVTLKHNEVGKYLHSHPFNYKTGSKEQQVTLYSYHTDYNNEWEIHPKTKRTDMRLFDQVNPIKNGDVVRLFHKATGKFLHVNNVRPPITEKDYANEVSCNGTRDLLGDINYEFKIHILDKKPHSKNNLPNIKLRATESVFQLFHQGTRCSLVAHQGKLPGWAFGQNEVLCINQPTIPNTLWYVEYNSHPMLDKDQSSERVNLGGLTFWKKFVEYQKVMWMFNKGMGGSHEYGSRPEAWPFLIRGTNYYSTDARVKTADEPGSHIYYFGNLAIYYFGVMAILFIGLKQVFYLINHLNPFMLPNETTNVSMFYQATMETILGYVVHYQPYFMMERELFLHHYLPAIYFCILTVTYFVEYQISKRKLFGYILVGVIGGLSLGCFVYFSPLIYGTDWSREACREAKWIGSWDFDCRTYKK